jgi:hypothetical protein
MFVQAKAIAAKMRVSVSRVRYPSGVALTFGQAVDSWAEGIAPYRFDGWSSTRRRPPSTLLAYER